MSLSEIRSGRRYKIINVKNTERALDLSSADNRSIIGYGFHGGDNQKWELQQDSRGWTLRNVSTRLYVAAEGHEGNNNNDYHDGTKAIGAQEPYKWHIWHESDNKLRICVPDVNRCLDLSNHGQGIDIEIGPKWHGENQLWYFDEA
ncbi:carbohydrate-binding module family 13 protein [Macrolepiota fuliginosa MF-IS2]|uniref:Carbohydrate-binding module family 13 protein n=1 Tax=Macrolepiota fuliginosa MF-IS2 TaxID=1400762 RepID=A0A9P6C1P6_9AGAR|nr:carbohydrate-binding module family 13 protein [Macrolepiota fuliginosa MF-IS2]